MRDSVGDLPTMLAFRPIDVDRESATSVAFSRDAFVCSFGSDERFLIEASAELAFAPYLDGLRRDVAREPEGFVHAWLGDEIVGAIMMRDAPAEERGYVRLFYLVPAQRGSGLSAELHAYMERYFRARSRTRVRLSVSPTNARALAFYTKHGWRDLGPRPEHEHVNWMELTL